MSKKVDIIVVNWNSGVKALHAIEPYIGYKSLEICCNIIVVDNASTDGSIELLKSRVNTLIINYKNMGFGKACNQAFKKCTGDYILLLNPDTLSKPYVLEGLVDFLVKNPVYGVAGPQQTGEHGEILRTCGRFPTFKTALFDVLGMSKLLPNIFTPAPIMTDWNHLQSKDVDHVMGSFMVIRRSALNKVGFMDDDYFVYMEDVDLSKRLCLAGYKTFFNTDYSIFHEGGRSGDTSTVERLFYSLSSRRVYWKKYFGKFSYICLTFLSIIIEPVLRIIGTYKKKKRFQAKIINSAYARYWENIIKRQ